MDGIKRVALVTGGNRGLGLETCIRLAKGGITVYLGCRNELVGRECVERLRSSVKLDVLFSHLDVDNPASIQAAAEKIEKEAGRLDILINNAGVLLESEENGLYTPTDKNVLLKTFETNVAGAYLMSEAILPIMQQNGYGRIVNVSSGMGQLVNMQWEFPAYRISKAALNAVTRIHAAKCRGTNILVNSICPGWVKTDMGGPDAPRSLAEGVETILWAATLEDGSPTGGFFRDKHPIPW